MRSPVYVAAGNADDDFADFQAAPPSLPATATATGLSAVAPVTAPARPNLMDLLASSTASNSTATYTPAQSTTTVGCNAHLS